MARTSPLHRPSLLRRMLGVLMAGVVGITLAAATVPAASADNEPAPLNGGEPAAAAPVTVRVPLVTVPNSFGQTGVLRIQVGRSAPMRVILDTGSTGLRLFPGALDRFRTGAKVTGTTISTPNDGGTLQGFVASAPITIGGVTTTRSVPFQVVKNTSSWVQQWLARDVYGILGIGTGRTPLPNPLLALPGNTGTSWSVHFGGVPGYEIPGGGALVLGASVPSDAVATLRMPPVGPDGYGALLWDDHKASGCWTIGSLRTTCMDTWLDSVAAQLTLAGPTFAALPTDADGVVKSGIPINMSAVGTTYDFWRIKTGTIKSYDYTVAKPKAPRMVNTGNRIYYDFTVTYDVTVGTISLSRKKIG